MSTNNLIELFLETAKINALSGNEKPLADYVKSFLSRYNYSIQEDNAYLVTNSNTGNLICRIGDGGEFVLTAHMDTARPTLNMKPLILEDKIASSGDTVLGVDNRVGVTTLLFLLQKISSEKIPVKNFTVAFTTCEETTLFGSKHLGLNGNIKYGFVFDSGYRPGNFVYSSCGALGFKIKVVGKASHSGIAPEKGINSLQIAAKAISNLPLGRIDDETTINIGILKGGTAVNVIPEITELEGEIRSFDADKVETYFKICLDTFKREAEGLGGKIEFDSVWDFKPYSVSEDSYVFKEIKSALEKVGLKPAPRISLGGSDANSLNEKGIVSVNLGIGAQNPHSNDEFVFIEDLVKNVEIALELVKKN
jgi:tripeptide aminopeptidase